MKYNYTNIKNSINKTNIATQIKRQIFKWPSRSSSDLLNFLFYFILYIYIYFERKQQKQGVHYFFFKIIIIKKKRRRRRRKWRNTLESQLSRSQETYGPTPTTRTPDAPQPFIFIFIFLLLKGVRS
jgi:predicted PurR-regulated permease PerM